MIVTETLTVGVLALQGAFAEHFAILAKFSKAYKISPTLVRTPEDLSPCAALIIPGGESTTIALLARLAGLLDPLKEFIKRGKPVWGTCAGAILLAEGGVEGGKKRGQELLGGIDVRIGRNGWGPQVESFEVPLYIEGLREQERPFVGVFIRAPIVLSLTPTSKGRPEVEVLASVDPSMLPGDVYGRSPTEDDSLCVVALRQGSQLLTTFHPELTGDYRFHEYFLRICVAERS